MVWGYPFNNTLITLLAAPADLHRTVGDVGDAELAADDQLHRDGPARAQRAPVPLLVKPVHRLQHLQLENVGGKLQKGNYLEVFEHALEVPEGGVLPEVLLDQLPQRLWFVRVDHIFREELVEANLRRGEDG